jgi:hypothetical protein
VASGEDPSSAAIALGRAVALPAKHTRPPQEHGPATSGLLALVLKHVRETTGPLEQTRWLWWLVGHPGEGPWQDLGETDLPPRGIPQRDLAAAPDSAAERGAKRV